MTNRLRCAMTIVAIAATIPMTLVVAEASPTQGQKPNIVPVVACVAGNVAVSSALSGLLSPVPGTGTYTYNGSVAFSLDCSAGTSSSCALCLKGTLLKSDGSTPPAFTEISSTYLTGTFFGCGTTGDIQYVSVTASSLKPSTTYKYEVVAAVYVPGTPCSNLSYDSGYFSRDTFTTQANTP